MSGDPEVSDYDSEEEEFDDQYQRARTALTALKPQAGEMALEPAAVDSRKRFRWILWRIENVPSHYLPSDLHKLFNDAEGARIDLGRADRMMLVGRRKAAFDLLEGITERVGVMMDEFASEPEIFRRIERVTRPWGQPAYTLMDDLPTGLRFDAPAAKRRIQELRRQPVQTFTLMEDLPQ